MRGRQNIIYSFALHHSLMLTCDGCKWSAHSQVNKKLVPQKSAAISCYIIFVINYLQKFIHNSQMSTTYNNHIP